MKFSIDRTALLRALNQVQSVVESRNTIPILRNVLMNANDGQLQLTTTDMDLEIKVAVPANINEGGTTTVPANTLHDIIKKMPEGSEVAMELDSNASAMEVKSGRSKFRLSCLPKDEFPELGGSDLPVNFSLAAADLRTLIKRTSFAISTEETRYYLNGIYVHAAETNGVPVLRSVATDGHRLAQYEMPLPEGAAQMSGIIIPRKAVNEIKKLVDDAADQVEITLSESKIRFSVDHIILTSKLIDGTFPDYQRVIPANNDKVIEVDPRIFSSAIDRVSTISDDKTRAVKIMLNGKTMTLSANSPDAGSATEDLEVNSEVDDIEIGFNAKYLMDITGLVKEGCVIRLADSASPTIITDAGDNSSLFVLMPLRV